MGLETRLGRWDTPTMTVVADNKKRVTLRHASPGDRFDVHFLEDGKVLLTKLEPAQPKPAKVRFEKCGAFTVGVLDRPIKMEALRQLLEEFP